MLRSRRSLAAGASGGDRLETLPRITPLQRVLSSQFVTQLGMSLSEHLPPAFGYAIAEVISNLIIIARPQVYWVLRENLSRVLGPEVDGRDLLQTVNRVIRNTARNNYELWHLVGRGPEALSRSVEVLPQDRDHLQRALGRGKGVVIAGVHTGNFDVCMLGLAAKGMDFQILGMATPPARGFELMDAMRRKLGVNLTSVSVESLRAAIRRLQRGGIVGSGTDRPIEYDVPVFDFFGRQAPIPDGIIRLALKTDASVIVAGAYRKSRHVNVMRLSSPMEMISSGNVDADLRVNMQRVVVVMEQAIRRHPEQWGMFVPVWPSELLSG